MTVECSFFGNAYDLVYPEIDYYVSKCHPIFPTIYVHRIRSVSRLRRYYPWYYLFNCNEYYEIIYFHLQEIIEDTLSLISRDFHLTTYNDPTRYLYLSVCRRIIFKIDTHLTRIGRPSGSFFSVIRRGIDELARTNIIEYMENAFVVVSSRNRATIALRYKNDTALIQIEAIGFLDLRCGYNCNAGR